MNNDIFDDIFNDPFFKQQLPNMSDQQQMRQQPVQVQERRPQKRPY